MVVLNDRKIRHYLKEKKIVITPEPYDIQIQPASVDLRLDNNYVRVNNNLTTCIDTRNDDCYYHKSMFTETSPLILHPHDFILAQTKEYVKLPYDLLGRVEGRSSIGRLGVAVHITAGFIDPGFAGNITLEICNLGTVPVILYPNQRVCQIVFEELNGECEKPYGTEGRNKYQYQHFPTPSAIHKDKNK